MKNSGRNTIRPIGMIFASTASAAGARGNAMPTQNAPNTAYSPIVSVNQAAANSVIAVISTRWSALTRSLPIAFASSRRPTTNSSTANSSPPPSGERDRPGRAGVHAEHDRQQDPRQHVVERAAGQRERAEPRRPRSRVR